MVSYSPVPYFRVICTICYDRSVADPDLRAFGPQVSVRSKNWGKGGGGGLPLAPLLPFSSTGPTVLFTRHKFTNIIDRYAKKFSNIVSCNI